MHWLVQVTAVTSGAVIPAKEESVMVVKPTQRTLLLTELMAEMAMEEVNGFFSFAIFMHTVQLSEHTTLF